MVLGTATLNFLTVMQTRRQIVCSQTIENPVSYAKMLSSPSAVMKLATLGVVPHILRNFSMSLALTPKEMGSKNEGLMGLYALGAALVSHPFEVARVMIVQAEQGKTIATLRALFEAEGIAGLYRGFIPRAIHVIPAMMAVNHIIDPRNSWIVEKTEGFSDNQVGLRAAYLEDAKKVRIF